MSFIRFESGTEKERMRQELREARQELLEKAEEDAANRARREVDKKLRGEDNWMHPSVLSKIEGKTSKNISIKERKSGKKTKKQKKGNNSKKEKKRKKRVKSETSSDEEVIKKNKKKRRNLSDETTNTDTSEDEHEWIEKPVESKSVNEFKTQKPLRDGWMTERLLLETYSKDTGEIKMPQSIQSYDPSKNSKELNPHWKNGGTGLPIFRRPQEDDGNNYHGTTSTRSDRNNFLSQGNWRKNHGEKQSISESVDKVRSNSKVQSKSNKTDIQPCPANSREFSHPSLSQGKKMSASSDFDSEEEKLHSQKSQLDFLTDQQMNEIGAKIIKAEIMGNTKLAKELSEKLDRARQLRSTVKSSAGKQNHTKPSACNKKSDEEHILLTTTDDKGIIRPLPFPNPLSSETDPYRGQKSRSKKAETHVCGERIRYFPDDDRFDIKQMFEREKYTTAQYNDLQFAEIAAKHRNPKDDLEDLFADKVRKNKSESEKAEKDKKQAIRDHEQLTKTLDDCQHCFDSQKMEKQLIVCMGKSVYLSLPWHEGLQPGHCLISPIQHISCSTQTDEDIWTEIEDFRKALTRMFESRSQNVIFFETARYLNRKPHLVIHCVPSKEFDLAPFYFKKAIQESEEMWSTNKQLILLKDRDVKRAIPRGLPYFWVHFGMESGFAHVIEDQNKFPPNFAQEIIAGILRLNPKSWRKPRREYNPIPKVKQFADWWKNFDCTKND